MPIRTLAALAAITAITTAALAGPLTPPAGPPASTNKTLQQVEPRTPVTSSVITEPGSYYLTSNFFTGIFIQTSGVTLDLNGFTVGPTLSTAITVSNAPDERPVVIKNGFIRNINGNGIDAGPAALLVLENVHITDVTGRGVRTANDAQITSCTVRDSSGDGFEVGGRAVIRDSAAIECQDGFDIESGTLENCLASDCTSDGFVFGSLDPTTVRTSSAINCTAHNSGSQGFTSTDAVALTNCTATEGSFQGFFMGEGSTLTGCLSQRNAQAGFFTNNTNTYLNCFAVDNGSTGFASNDAASYTNCTAVGNGGSGFSVGGGVSFNTCSAEFNFGRGFVTGVGCAFTACSASENGLDGFVPGAGSTLAYCVASGNIEDGFALNSDCRITHSTADGNGGGPNSGNAFAGIRGSSDTTIDSCTVTDNPTGIIGGSGGLAIRNSAAGNGNDYSFTGTDHGAIITPIGAFTSTNAFANISY